MTALTIATSLIVSYSASNQFFGTVKMPTLRNYGGTTFEDLQNLELWRVATAQLIHAKQAHMLLNALCLLLLGGLVESKLGGLRTFSIWLIAGGVATALSPIFIEAPWDVGTGASQATFAFAGCATALAIFGFMKQTPAWILIVLVAAPGLTLDIIYSGYPKLGHVAGFALGFSFGIIYSRCSRQLPAHHKSTDLQ